MMNGFMQLAALSLENCPPVLTNKHADMMNGTCADMSDCYRQKFGRPAEAEDIRPIRSHLQFPLNIKTEAMDVNMMAGQMSPLGLGITTNGTHIRATPGGYPPLVSSPGSMGSSGSDSYIGAPGNQSDDSNQTGKGGRARKLKEDKYCGVCGDRALGYNFDAISCESCKAFFRRNALKGLEYFKCPYDEKCKMDISNRRFCKRCRLKKCFEIGMRKEYILTDEEKQRKRQKIEENRWVSEQQKRQLMTTTPHLPRSNGQQNYTTHVAPIMNRDLEKRSMVSPPVKPAPCQSSTPEIVTSTQPLKTLTSEELELIDEVVQAYKTSLEVSVEGPPRDQSSCMADLVNIAELSVRRVIDMSKKIKSFKALSQADQISLLKGGSIELLILRSVLTYDKDKQQFLDENDPDYNAMTTDQLKQAEGGLFEDHMKFVRSLAVDLRADELTLILLLVVSLFSPDRPNLLDKPKVCQEQERYSLLLQSYLESKYPYHQAKAMYPKYLMKLVDIRNLNEDHSAVLVKVNPEGIQPLMIELLDLRT
ncbi:vitamin D3 receptor-like isoform X2 [Tubulanus polymorphus]|uniref:vitamin D3 receptor-like isoform X2 n=1 Tax=Tubulanus polymorphus TaxID=672921 RepID=UPI003DA5D917